MIEVVGYVIFALGCALFVGLLLVKAYYRGMRVGISLMRRSMDEYHAERQRELINEYLLRSRLARERWERLARDRWGWRRDEKPQEPS